MSEERVGAARECRDDPVLGWTGAWSPILGDGLLFYLIQSPTGDVVDETERARLQACADKLRTQVNLALDPWGRDLSARLVEHCKIDADDLAVCIDAATGKTMWKTYLKNRSLAPLSYNKHVDQGRVGCYADGKVYLVGRTLRVYCLEARTGKLMWESETPQATAALEKEKSAALAGRRKAGGAFSANYPILRLAGKTLFYTEGQIYALDRDTGKLMWTHGAGFGPQGGKVTLDGKEYILCAGGHPKTQLACLDPASGKDLWKAEIEGNPRAAGFLRMLGTTLIGVGGTKTDPAVVGFRIEPAGPRKLWEFPTPGFTLNTMYTSAAADGLGYLRLAGPGGGMTAQRMLCVDLAGGMIASQADFQGVFIGQVAAMNGYVFTQPDGCHCTTYLNVYSLKDLKSMGAWNPSHCQTSAYDIPQLWLPVDGRIIMRGRTRLFCYDLRKPRDQFAR